MSFMGLILEPHGDQLFLILPWSHPTCDKITMCIIFSILHLKHYTKHHLTSLKHYFVQMTIWRCMHFKVVHFLKKQKSTKVHVSKAIKPILIRAHLHIPNMYTFRNCFWNLRKNNYVKDLKENMAQFWPFKSP
jgi:hypothetical protein